MASISYPTTMNVAGPWLLDAKSLGELDDLIDSCVEKMRENRDRSIESAVASRVAERYTGDRSKEELETYAAKVRQEIAQDYNFRGDSRSLTVYLSGGRAAEGATFRELFSLPNVHGEIPRGFTVATQVASTKIEIKLGSWSSSGLTVDVSSDNVGFSQELFGRIQNWVTEIQPKRWLQMWLEHAPTASFVLIWIWCMVVVVALCIVAIPVAGPNPIEQQARDLVKQGVNPSNQIHAIQLLLALESDYDPGPHSLIHHHAGYRFWICSFLSLVILLGLRKPPKGAIGIWGGRNAVERQRRWIHLVSVAVPGLLTADILIPWLWGLLTFRR